MSASWVVDDLVDDAAELFDGPVDDLVAVLEEIASLSDVEAPTPSAELALLLAGRPVPHRPARRTAAGLWVPVRGHRRLAPVLGGLAAAAVAGLTLTGSAAYANELPPSVQRVVAHLSEDYLPFTFPRPVGDPPAPVPVSQRGAGAQSSGGASGGASAGADPSAVAKSRLLPVLPSTGGPTDRADGRLVRQELGKPQMPGPTPAATPSPVRVRPAVGPFEASTVVGGTDAPAVVMTPAAPAQASESPTDAGAPVVVPPPDPQTTPSAPTSTDPVPSAPTSAPPSAPSVPPSVAPSDPTPGPSPDTGSSPSGPQTTTPPGSQPSTTPGAGTPPSAGSDVTNGTTGKTASPSAGTDAPTPGPTTTAPPGSPADPGGSLPAGQVSSSPDFSASSSAVGSGDSPATDVVGGPGTAGSAAPTTPGQ